jgi:uncharacterized coiled-coil DUF342 family protein
MYNIFKKIIYKNSVLERMNEVKMRIHEIVDNYFDSQKKILEEYFADCDGLKNEYDSLHKELEKYLIEIREINTGKNPLLIPIRAPKLKLYRRN